MKSFIYFIPSRQISFRHSMAHAHPLEEPPDQSSHAHHSNTHNSDHQDNNANLKPDQSNSSVLNAQSSNEQPLRDQDGNASSNEELYSVEFARKTNDSPHRYQAARLAYVSELPQTSENRNRRSLSVNYVDRNATEILDSLRTGHEDREAEIAEARALLRRHSLGSRDILDPRGFDYGRPVSPLAARDIFENAPESRIPYRQYYSSGGDTMGIPVPPAVPYLQTMADRSSAFGIHQRASPTANNVMSFIAPSNAVGATPSLIVPQESINIPLVPSFPATSLGTMQPTFGVQNSPFPPVPVLGGSSVAVTNQVGPITSANNVVMGQVAHTFANTINTTVQAIGTPINIGSLPHCPSSVSKQHSPSSSYALSYLIYTDISPEEQRWADYQYAIFDFLQRCIPGHNIELKPSTQSPSYSGYLLSMPKVTYTSAASSSAEVGVSSGAASVPSSSGVLAGSNASTSPPLPISFPLPSSGKNPFGTLPAVNEILFKNDRRQTASEQPLNVKAASSLIPRNVLHGTKLRSHSHRHPLNGEAQQALFQGTDSIRIPREDFSFVPLEDPRALVISEMHPKEHSFEHRLSCLYKIVRNSVKYPSIYDVALGMKQMIWRISQCIQDLAKSFLNLDCQNKEMEKLPEMIGNEQVELVEMLSVKSMVGETTARHPEFDRLFFYEMRQTSIIKINGKQKDIDLKDATPRSKSQNSDVQVASISTSTPRRCSMESRQECNDDTPGSNSESSDIQVASSTSTSARYLIESRLECNDDHPLAHSINARRRALSYAEKHSTDVAKSLPKVGKPDYYTSPSIEELMQRERAAPGFCSKVPDIVVGCKGHGHIKFLGETDVRGLKLDDIVVFKTNGDVSVYANDNDVPIGKGLNKPAEVTLENIRPGMDKDTGKQQEVDEFIEELQCKCKEQGTQYMSYDSEKGEWTFRVQHF